MRADIRCATQRATVLVDAGPRLEGTTGETTLAHADVLALSPTRRLPGGTVVYVAAMEVQTEALELRVGVRPTRDLPRVVANALAAGIYSSALEELAGLIGLSGGERSGVIGRLSEAALRDLGVADLKRDEAAELLVQRYARQIVDGALRPIDGGAKINRAVVDMGWDGGGQPLWDEGTCEIYQLMDTAFGYPQPPG